MPRTTSITIGEHLDRFINDMIESGRYGSTSESFVQRYACLKSKNSVTTRCVMRWRRGFVVVKATSHCRISQQGKSAI